MKRSLFSLITFSLLASFTSAQSVADQERGPDYFIFPEDGVDFEKCFQDLDAADVSPTRDGGVRQPEFLGFLQKYARRKCLQNESLNLQQFAAFNALSCVCASLEGQDQSCCLGENGQIDTGGALTPGRRTQPQVQFLTYVCITIDNTLRESACDPEILGRATPPPVIIAPGGTIPKAAKVEEEEDDDDIWDWLLWVLIALAILLLLLCCCCCTIRRKRLLAIAAEEEEEERRSAERAAAARKRDVEAPPEQYAADVNETEVVYEEQEEEEEIFVVTEDESESAPAIDEEMAAVAGAGNNDDDDDSEDGGKQRGVHNLPDDEDDGGRRIGGYGQLPPDEDPDRDPFKLRPIPPKEPEEDPDWDHPGRDINFPKPEPDEYSAGEYEHYEPDGGVNWPEREGKAPVSPHKPQWERLKKETPDEIDMRKRRIQTGLGDGAVWDKLGEEDDHADNYVGTDVFDWVVSSALGVLQKSESAEHLGDDQQS
jgi:hypothetical protein